MAALVGFGLSRTASKNAIAREPNMGGWRCVATLAQAEAYAT